MEDPAEAEVVQFMPTQTPRPSVVSEGDREYAVWDTAASHAVDNATGVVVLEHVVPSLRFRVADFRYSYRSLCEMPPKFVEDLKAFFVPKDAAEQDGSMPPPTIHYRGNTPVAIQFNGGSRKSRTHSQLRRRSSDLPKIVIQ